LELFYVGNLVDGACPNHTSQSPFLVGACGGVEGLLLIKGVSPSPPPSSSSVKIQSNLVINGRIFILYILCKISATGRRVRRRGS
jgi:hypothetical protein